MSKPKKVFSVENEVDESKIRELGNKKSFHPHDLVTFQPKTDAQKKFFEMYYSQCPVIFQDGPAGTGKSAVSIFCALSEVFDQSTPYDKLYVVRTAVDVREQGFLPGEQEDKNTVYERPYRSLVDGLIKYKKSYDNLKALGYYEFMTTAHLRGVTLDDCIVIVDECQNADYNELLTIITRVGVNCKIIFCGDNRQDDLDRKRQKSGFVKFKEILGYMSNDTTGFVDYKLEDIVRSGIVYEFLVADYKYYNT